MDTRGVDTRGVDTRGGYSLSELKRKLDETQDYFDLELFKTIRKIILGQVYLTKSELDQIEVAVEKSIRELEPIDRETYSAHKWLAAMESPVATGNFEIRVESRVFHIEKSVLAARSPVFAAYFEQKELKEGKEKSLLIENFGAVVVEQFLLYCYISNAPRLNEIAADMASMAHQFQVTDLLDKCEIFLIQDAIRFHRKNDNNSLMELAQLAADIPLRILLVAFHCIISERFKWSATREQDIWVTFFEKRPQFNTERYKAVYSLARDTVCLPQMSPSNSAGGVFINKMNLIPPMRVVSAYRLFVSDEQRKMKAAKVQLSSEEIVAEIAQRWVAADSVTKLRYEKLSTDDRKRYLIEKKTYDAELKKALENKMLPAKRPRRDRSPAGDGDDH